MLTMLIHKTVIVTLWPFRVQSI